MVNCESNDQVGYLRMNHPAAMWANDFELAVLLECCCSAALTLLPDELYVDVIYHTKTLVLSVIAR
jgi:hypothetical protein